MKFRLLPFQRCPKNEHKWLLLITNKFMVKITNNAEEANSSQDMSEEKIIELADSMLCLEDPNLGKGKHWSRCETLNLIKAIIKFSTSKGIKWKQVIKEVSGKTVQQAQSRYFYIRLKVNKQFRRLREMRAHCVTSLSKEHWIDLQAWFKFK
ncbi:unnamed protein product [Blepharisma stoltei]|uniref:Myb-like domain-containing protein n=1 Tax=Blepharisma stoltei TaxID=1481888 RepID=A0AAU9J4V3_9CILI|nr:unnamed protein product [Blepharisma stoltei]